MKFEAFQAFAATNHWGAIWPELSLAVLALVVLALDAFLPVLRRHALPALVLAGQVIILVLTILSLGSHAGDASLNGTTAFSGMIAFSTLGNVMRVFFLLCSILVCYIAWVYFQRQNLPRIEFYVITMLIAAAAMLLGQSNNFVMLFVALETMTIAFYVLTAYARNSAFSLESGLKYLVTGALSSAILLFGIVLLYGASGDASLPYSTSNGFDFQALATFISANPELPLVRIGAALVLCGICFKIGAVPFQIWVPDVYQGAPTPATAYLAVASKAAGFVILINLVRGPFASLSSLTLPMLSAICAVTILFGNLTAVGQRNVKRIIGLSGIAHAGYLLLGIVALIHGIDLAIWAIVFYLFAYLLGSFAVFGVMVHVANDRDEFQELEHYRGLARNQPLLGAVLGIGLGSLAGIPPLAGFMGKLFLFIAAFQAGLYTLLGIAILGVVISIYYYFGWIREAFFKVADFPADEPPAISESRKRLASLSLGYAHRTLLTTLAVLTILLGFYQGIFGSNPF